MRRSEARETGMANEPTVEGTREEDVPIELPVEEVIPAPPPADDEDEPEPAEVAPPRDFTTPQEDQGLQES